MANAFQNPQQTVNLGIGLLNRKFVLSNLFTRLGVSNFPYQTGKGRSVDFPLPTRLSAARSYALDNDRSTSIVIDELEEHMGSITLTDHFYKGLAVTDEQLTWDIRDYGAQILDPMTDVIVAACEAKVAAALAAAPALYQVSFSEDDGDPARIALRAGQAMTKEGVPLAGRKWIVGANQAAAVAGNEKFQRAVQASQDSSLLREATIGRISGFDVVESQAVGANFGAFIHPTALGIANVAPAVPKGAYAGARTESNGWAMRWLYDYEALKLRDRTILSTFLGVMSLNDHQNANGEQSGRNARIVKVNFTGAEDDDAATIVTP